MNNLRVHYMDKHDEDSVCEIDQGVLTRILNESIYGGEKITPRQLADSIDETLIVIDNDPRQSLLMSCDVFISYNDLCNHEHYTQILLSDLEEA